MDNRAYDTAGDRTLSGYPETPDGWPTPHGGINQNTTARPQQVQEGTQFIGGGKALLNDLAINFRMSADKLRSLHDSLPEEMPPQAHGVIAALLRSKAANSQVTSKGAIRAQMHSNYRLAEQFSALARALPDTMSEHAVDGLRHLVLSFQTR